MYLKKVWVCIVEALGLAEPSYYYYLNQSGTYKVQGTDDNKEFQDTWVSSHKHIVHGWYISRSRTSLILITH